MPTLDEMFDVAETEQSGANSLDAMFDKAEQEEKQRTIEDVQRYGVEAPQQAIGALQRALPVGLATMQREQRREDLARQTEEARAATARSRFGLGVAEVAERTAEALTPSGMLNQPARLLGKQDVYQPGAPLIQIPRNPALEGTAAGGVANVALGAIESMTTPEMIVTAPAMAASALARGAMAFDMARHIPEQVAQSAETFATPESTAQEKVEAIGGPLLGALFAGALARGHVAAPKEIPALRGRALEQPIGAQAPRIEAPPEIQRATPAEAAQTATRMQRTATAAYEAPRAKRVQVPEYSTPLAEQGRMPEEMPPPAVQPEAPRPREIATWDDAVSAVRERAKGTETREQIQALLPEITISREGAAELAREVFGENWKPGGAERAPGPKPVEGLSQAEQEILAKARTTTMTAEERALAKRMMSGELERPSEAPQAPVVERPSETTEVQRQKEEGSETVTAPQNRPAIESEARIETRQGKEEGQGAIDQSEPAPVAQEPTPAPSPTPEAPKAPEPVQPAPLTASMESARSVLAMTPAEFAQRAKSFNKTNLELGRQVSDAELAELEGMAAKADERWQQARARAASERTPEAMDEMMALSSMPQYFNEAIAEARRIRERTPNVAESERRVSSGESPNREELRNVPEQGQGPGEVAPNIPVQETVKPVPVEGDLPLPTKAVQHSINRALDAAGLLRGLTQKHSMEKAYATLRLHAGKLGIETPGVGTYFSVDAYRKAAAEVAIAIGKKYGTHPTQELRDLRDKALGQRKSKSEPSKPSGEPIPAKPETKPVSTATAAAKQVATEVKSVASSEGQRPAKEVKSELVQRLEKALDEATSTTEEYFEGVYVQRIAPQHLTTRPVEGTQPLKDWLGDKRSKNSEVLNRDTDLGRKFIGDTLARKEVPKITIEIPGDGTFTIWNTKTAIGELLEKAKKISTKAGEPVAVKRAGTSKADKEWIEQTLKEGSEKQTPEPSTSAEPIGMGGAVPSEFERVTGSPTQMKYADLDADRISRGLEPLTRPESVADAEVQQRAFEALDRDPAAPEKLISELLDNPRAISDVETHMLLLHRIDIRQERMKALQRARQAYEDSKQFPNRLADVAKEGADAQRLSDQLERLEKAAGLAGTEKGRALRAQQIMMNEDYSLEAMQSRALAARNFRELPPEKAAQELAELTKLSEEHKAKSDALSKRIQELEAEAIMKDAQAKKAAPAYHPRVIEMAETYARKWDDRGKQALAELKTIFTGGGEGKLFSGAPIGPEVIDKLAIYGISKLVRGAVDLAKWTDAMVKDIGEGFRPYAEQIWNEANARLEKDLTASEAKFGRDAKAVKTAIKTGSVTAPVTPQTIITRMQRSRAKNPKADISTLARKLARIFVEQGVKDRNVLVDKVHEALKQVDPAITRRGTMETLSGYGDYSRLPQDQVSVILRDLQGQMQQILKLEDMAAGKAPERTGRERRIPSDEERRLQMRVEEAKRRGGYTVTDPATQLRTALDEVKKRLQNQITDLELQIQTKAKIVKEKTPVQEDAETQKLRARRDELKAQFDEIFAEPELTDAQRLEAWKDRTRDRIEEAQGILEGTRQRRQKRAQIEMDSEALRLRYDLHQIERQIREREVAEKMANRPTYQKVIGEIGETANTARALMTSFDFSAPLRQGLIITAAHPVRSAVAFPEMFRAAFSAEKAFGQAEALRNRPNAPLYESSGLYLAEHGGRLSTMEEAFMSRRAEKLPIIGRGIRASQRAYTSYLNRIRADSFDAMTKGLTRDGRGNPEELKAIANFINVATGRGSVAWNQAATTLNTVFFAPRYVASRFEYLAGQPLYKGTARTRKMIINEYGRFLAGAAVVYALAKAAGGEVGTDPNSADFGKIKIGNTRIDPMAGLLQATVLASRVGSIYGSKLGINKAPEQHGKKLELDKVLMNFLRGKLAPVPGLVVSVGTGKYPGGEKVTPANLAGSITPISWQDIYEATKDQGVPAGLALGVLSIFGTGVQTYEQGRK